MWSVHPSLHQSNINSSEKKQCRAYDETKKKTDEIGNNSEKFGLTFNRSNCGLFFLFLGFSFN